MEVNQIFIRKKSPKINSLLKEDNDSPRTPSPPKSGKKKLGQPSPILCHIERAVTEKVEKDDIPEFELSCNEYVIS
jgi:hypothetical protein